MERFLDKAIVLACCLAVVGCMLAETGVGALSANASDARTLPLAACMLAAIASAAAFEIFPAPFDVAASCAYCVAACFMGDAAPFVPLAAYDLTRCIHDPGIRRASGVFAALALGTCLVGQTLSPIATATLFCITAAAVALSARTSSALARQRLAQTTRDTLKSQALRLRDKNLSLAEALDELKETSKAAAEQAVHNSDAPTRPAAFACLTEREWEVARLVAEGLDNREIAATAYLSEGTVRNNISSILSKMILKNRTQIAITFWKTCNSDAASQNYPEVGR